MRKEKKQAMNLRSEGRSYNEISKLLHISKSTLSGWFKDDPKSQITKALLSKLSNPIVAQRIKRFVKLNRVKWEKFREEAREEARREFPKLIKDPLFIAGIIMYWGEGDNKVKNPVRFTNTDPRMIRLYTRFATKAIGIPMSQLRIGLIIYPEIDPVVCKKYWMKILDIPQTQFHKTQVIKGRHPTKRLLNGICMVTLGSRRLKEKFLVWIDLLSKNL